MITNNEMRTLEINSEYFGFSKLQLMENAGRSVADEISSRFSSKKNKVVIFCGMGRTGGNGLVAARHLLSKGFNVAVTLAGKSKDLINQESKKNWWIRSKI